MLRAPIQTLRPICLPLPEAEERETGRDPTVRVRERSFATAKRGDGRSCALVAPRPPAGVIEAPALQRVVVRAVALAAMLAAAPVAAAPVEAHYVVRQAGFQVMEARVRLDLDGRGYRVVADTRTTGLALLFANSASRVRVEGAWRGHAAIPTHFASAGTWNGRPRRIEIRYRGEEAELVAQEPPDAGERTPVAPDQRRGTVDILSALARLVRQAGATGRCDGEQSVYDGRRRLEWAARTDGVVSLVPAGGLTGGPALRCTFSSRIVAGFRLGDDPAVAGRARSGTAWLATVRPDLPPLPVRIEFPSGLWGTLRAELVRVDEAGAGRSDGSGD